jgi:hypothetical protein
LVFEKNAIFSPKIGKNSNRNISNTIKRGQPSEYLGTEATNDKVRFSAGQFDNQTDAKICYLLTRQLVNWGRIFVLFFRGKNVRKIRSTETRSYHVSEVDDVVLGQRVQEVDHVMLDQLPLIGRHLVRHDVEAFIHL